MYDVQWYTVEPPNKGHYGTNDFETSVLCREVVPILEGPLSVVHVLHTYVVL